MINYSYEFYPGDKVLFHGLKATVCEFGPLPNSWRWWAVPIEIKGSTVVTLAHVDSISRRGTGKRR